MIFDSKGQKFIDLDSNYSATNLGNANPEIALGLFNQVDTVVSAFAEAVKTVEPN